VTTNVEHASVLAPAEPLRAKGVEVVILPVDENGVVDSDAMLDAIEPGATLVSIQWANDETGVVQAIPELARVAHGAGALFHTDAVQAVGKVPIDFEQSPIDFLSLSGHKIHGPPGIGALVGPGVHLLQPLWFGGAQEKGLRPGTENVPGIVGLGLALEIRSLRFEAVALETRELRDHFEAQLARRELVVAFNGAAAPRLPNTSSVQFADIDGEALTTRLDKEGLRCSRSSTEPSYVLRAMGLNEAEAYASVSFSFSELNTLEEVDAALESIGSLHASLDHPSVA
jgi:cysteine desulfurase